ncbi:3-oxoacyl-[acyl-carrier-protein] synthase III C-terminal domain-containing protein [Sorangium sp. So ce302]|uniref:3-oxoacyl-ACP synthase III family protein n=1 Tax=Sorangium sp. So ce302 TaxID=3133297 RepID=UPI003F60E70B
MTSPVGIKSLAVSYPHHVRTNDYVRTRYPRIVEAVERKTLRTPWSAAADTEPANAFDRALSQYRDDPFRGTVERRALAAGESVLSLEARAARDTLGAAGVAPTDVDLMIVSSFLPDQIGVGNAAFLARELGVRGAAWNLETTCSGALVALESACALVQTRRYATALVVVSCSYSRTIDEASVLSWPAGDGAGAFLITHVPSGEGLLGMKTIHTAETCGIFFYELSTVGAAARIRMGCDARAGEVLRETSEVYLRRCCEGAAKEAGLSLSNIDFFVFNTPTAWFTSFATEVLGIAPSRTVNAYPRYGNIGPALTTANLYLAASEGRLKRGDTVLLYSIGSVSTASAAVIRWGDVRLGAAPEPGLIG